MRWVASENRGHKLNARVCLGVSRVTFSCSYADLENWVFCGWFFFRTSGEEEEIGS